MKLARQWIILGLCYYILRAIIVIFPYWSKESTLQRVFIVIQAVVAMLVILIVAQSYKYDLNAIKYGLYMQSFIFILSNFNMYRADRLENY